MLEKKILDLKIMIALSVKDDKRVQSTNSIETYAYGTNEEIIQKKKEIKCINIIKQYTND